MRGDMASSNDDLLSTLVQTTMELETVAVRTSKSDKELARSHIAQIVRNAEAVMLQADVADHMDHAPDDTAHAFDALEVLQRIVANTCARYSSKHAQTILLLSAMNNLMLYLFAPHGV